MICRPLNFKIEIALFSATVYNLFKYLDKPGYPQVAPCFRSNRNERERAPAKM